MNNRLIIAFILLWLLVPQRVVAQAVDLTSLSFEQLMDVEVVSAAKHKQKLSDVSAAVYVLSNEDIRRSGATSIADALRLVPGVQVSRASSNRWSVSARGFQGIFSNMLLLLVDGRSIYTSVFSGVFWEVQDIPLRDVERVEVIRGPGATLWGANAVNGVINIITKNSSDTKGVLLEGHGGNEEQGGLVRYGDKLGESGSYRLYVLNRNINSFNFPEGDSQRDLSSNYKIGFRTDSRLSDEDRLTTQGDIYFYDSGGLANEPSTPTMPSQVNHQDLEDFGYNLLSKWDRSLSKGSSFYLQAYLEYQDRKATFGDFETVTADLEAQHDYVISSSLSLSSGLNWRLIHDDLNFGKNGLDTTNSERTTSQIAGHLQVQKKLFDDKLVLTLGSKLEDNDFTGFEIQPNARALYHLSESSSVWSSLTRAIRTPSRIEQALLLDNGFVGRRGGIPIFSKVVGSHGVDAEELWAIESGFRTDINKKLSLDLAGFVNVYDKLLSVEPAGVVPGATGITSTLEFDNKLKAKTYGAELALNYFPADWLRFKGTYSWLQMELDLTDGGMSATGLDAEGRSPENQATLHTSLDLPSNLEFDSMIYYVDSLPAHGVSSYTKFNFRLGWVFCEGMDVSLIVENAFDDDRVESGNSPLVPIPAGEVPRSVFLRLTAEL